MIEKSEDVVVVHSGGLDSSVLLAKLHAEGASVESLSVHYGQRHSARELEMARRFCAEIGVAHTEVDLSGLGKVLPGSALTDESVPVPHGHYADESMRSTVVPNRNMMLLAVAGARAVATGAKVVAYGAHAGDHAVYPDCRVEFMEAMQGALALCDYAPVRLYAPFAEMSKADIAKWGDDLGAPMNLTWSCYEGGALHCGKCGTCFERIEAFMLAGVPDPTEYAA